MSLYFAEITGDNFILEAEAKIMREKGERQGGSLEMGSRTIVQRSSNGAPVPAEESEIT